MIKKVGIIGCGQMGSGIAQVSAQAGYQVICNEVSEELYQKGLRGITKQLDKAIEKGKLDAAAKAKVLGNITGTTDLADLADCDIVIEAATEDMAVKKEAFKELDKICKPETIFASNTSSLPIGDLAAVTSRRAKFLGLHFFNPVPVMKLIEVVKSLTVSEETINVSVAFGKSLGKEPVVVKDSPGFIANRIANVAANEALKVLEEGLASADDIDKVCRLAFNWPIGLLQMVDLVGADVVLDLAESIYKETGWERYKPAPILKRMVESGYLGNKANKGIYTLFVPKQ